MNNKLNPEQIKKLVLCGILLCFVFYWYFVLLLPGLKKSENATKKMISDMRPKIEAAERQIAAVRGLEKEAPNVANILDALKSMIPDESPIAWFPPRMKDFFERHGIQKVRTSIKRDSSDIRVSGLKRVEWTIEIPVADAVSLGIAIAGLENEDPLVEVRSVQISRLPDNIEYQRATLTLSSLVKP